MTKSKTYTFTIPKLLEVAKRIEVLKKDGYSDTSIMVRIETELDTEEACKPK